MNPFDADSRRPESVTVGVGLLEEGVLEGGERSRSCSRTLDEDAVELPI